MNVESIELDFENLDLETEEMGELFDQLTKDIADRMESVINKSKQRDDPESYIEKLMIEAAFKAQLFGDDREKLIEPVLTVIAVNIISLWGIYSLRSKDGK